VEDVADGDAHVRLAHAGAVKGAAAYGGFILVLAVFLIHPKLVGLFIVGLEDVGEIIVGDLGGDYAPAAAGRVEAGFLRDVFECAIPIVVIDDDPLARELVRPAIVANAGNGLAHFLGIKGGKVNDDEIQETIAIEIGEGRR